MPPCTTQTKKDCIRRVREAAACCLRCPSPRLAQHHRQRFLLHLRFFQWQKEPREKNLALFIRVLLVALWELLL